MKFAITFNRIEAKQARAPRWTVTWREGGEERTVVVDKLRSAVPLETADDYGAMVGDGHAYLIGRALEITVAPLAASARDGSRVF
jgi:hypothetical protein